MNPPNHAAAAGPHAAAGARRLAFDEVYYRLLEECPRLRAIACQAAQAGTFAFAAEWRRNLVFNAGLALGPAASRAAKVRCAYRMLGSMQRSIAEVFASRAASPDELRAGVTTIDGTNDYLAARSLGRGVVIAGIHMGAFEPALATLRVLEPRVHVLFQPDPMPRFERARSELRRRLGVIEHRISDGLGAWMALLDALRANEAVVIHADRTMPGQRGVRTPFLGLTDASLPAGPLRLATSHGSPIVPTFCARTSRGLRVWADPFIATEPERLVAQDVANHPAQRSLVAAIERAIRAYPDQWMALADLRDSSKERRMP